MGIDLLRIVSMFMILILHVLGQGGILAATSPTDSAAHYNVAWLLEICAYCAVNCYALISGYVGIKSKFKFTNIIFLWLQVAFYTVSITLIFSFVKPEAVTAQQYWAAFFPVMKRAYWYFSAYFCMFFFIPVLNFLVNNMKKRELRLTVIFIVVLFSVFYTVARTGYFGNAVDDLFVTAKGYSPLWLALLYLVGAYISKHRADFKIRPIYCFVVYIIAILITWAEKICLPKSVLVSYTSPTILVCAIALLLAFSQLKLTRLSPVIKFLSPLAFSVYLMHVHPLVWQYFMKGRFSSYAELPAPLMALSVIGTALLIYLLCSAIDLIRHYLFKLLRLKQGLNSLEEKLKAKGAVDAES